MMSVQRLFSVALYNQRMSGVELVDQCVAMSPSRPRNKRNKRWYIRLLSYFLDVTFVNKWYQYLMSRLEKMNPIIFKASLAHALINAGSLQQSKRGRPSGTLPAAKGKT
ncbi:hypothetical protein ATANTOWER_002597, partial [Ataeniobius toweri]|nr:hypothetical protein [Ataeniobius toweri]